MTNQADGQTMSILEAIGDLWLIVLAIGAIIAMILFRKPITGMLDRLSRVQLKRGGTELVAEQAPPQSEVETAPPQEVLDASQPDGVQEKTTGEAEHPLSDMIIAFLDGRSEDAESAFQQWQESEEDEIERIRNRAFYLSERYKHLGDASAAEQLEELSANPDARSHVLFRLGTCYGHAKNYEEAEDAFKKALDAASSDQDRVNAAVSVAGCKRHLGAHEQALSILGHALTEVTAAKAKGSIYRAIGSIEKSRGDPRLQALALEKAVECDPTNTKVRFDAAYAQSEAGLRIMSVLNYGTMLDFDPADSTGLNNLGVICERLELPIRAVSFYHKSANAKSTLAMANLAYRYLKGGFSDEASQILDTAKQESDLHPNVGSAIAAVSARLKEEEKLYEEVVEIGEKQQQFLRRFAEAYYLPTDRSHAFSGSWVTADGDNIEVKQDGQQIHAVWHDGRRKSVLDGTARNRGAQIQLRTTTESGTILGAALGAQSEEGFGFVESDGLEMHLILLEEKSAKFLRFTRGNTASTGVGEL